MLIELAQSIGLSPKKTSYLKGGEFHSACPSCGGNDRFIIWPAQGCYWCRQCKKAGDAIQFCRDFVGMDFREACARVGDPTARTHTKQACPHHVLPSQSWKSKGEIFIQSCLQRLLVDPNVLNCVKERGLSLGTIQRYSIGWNPVTLFSKREDWGLEKRLESGKEKKLWLPSGIIIPTYQEESLRKIKIRRDEWKEGDNFGKYYILPGSSDCVSIFGNPSIPVVILVEAELDAMLIAQEVGALCCCIALGGAQKRPDEALRQWLLQKQLIIFALDFDEAGKKEYAHWNSTYPNLWAWPVPEGKSPADAWKLGVNLNEWVSDGIKRSKVNSTLGLAGSSLA
jgi:DNA primase